MWYEFMIESNKEECFVEMRMISGSGYNALHIGCNNGENTVTGNILYYYWIANILWWILD